MRPAQRFRLVGALVAAAELALGLLLIGTVLGWYFVATAATSFGIAMVASRALEPRGDDGGHGGGGRGDGPDDPGPPDPPWWPGFERDLLLYEQQLREKSPTC